MERKQLIHKIEEQEKKDLEIVDDLFNNILNGKYELSGAPYGYNIDAVLSFTSNTSNKVYKFDIEIKNRLEHKSTYYDTILINQYKINFMKNVNKYGLLLINIYQDAIYIHNVNKIDWSKIKTKEFNIKKTTFDDDSKRINSKCYLIPFNLGSRFERKYES